MQQNRSRRRGDDSESKQESAGQEHWTRAVQHRAGSRRTVIGLGARNNLVRQVTGGERKGAIVDGRRPSETDRDFPLCV